VYTHFSFFRSIVRARTCVFYWVLPPTGVGSGFFNYIITMHASGGRCSPLHVVPKSGRIVLFYTSFVWRAESLWATKHPTNHDIVAGHAITGPYDPFMYSPQSLFYMDANRNESSPTTDEALLAPCHTPPELATGTH
jgi:hypothetical protein